MRSTYQQTREWGDPFLRPAALAVGSLGFGGEELATLADVVADLLHHRVGRWVLPLLAEAPAELDSDALVVEVARPVEDVDLEGHGVAVAEGGVGADRRDAVEVGRCAIAARRREAHGIVERSETYGIDPGADQEVALGAHVGGRDAELAA